MPDFLMHLPLGLWLALAGLLLAVSHTRLRAPVLLGLPAVLLWLLWSMPTAHHAHVMLLGLELVPLDISALGRIFATVFLIMVAVGGLFAYRHASRLELASALLYAGSALTVVLAGDLITVLLGWEMMAIGSSLVIWSAGTPAAYRAGMRYVAAHLLGGVLLMAGIAGQVASTGQTEFTAMRADSLPTMLILAGFLVNAGAPPLSSWIADAYPETSPSGMVFLSAFTTKTAVYALLRGFPGEELLIYIGLFMVFYGIIYALLENDMRRILAYSIVNQVGFMVAGAGIGTAMAVNGAAAHAFCHIIYKALLLMSAGSVMMMTQRRKCTELGGLYHSMKLTAICGIIGALAISAFPFTSGFVSKSMISQAAAEQHLLWVWLALAAASAGVFLHAGIKFPWFVFFQKDSGLRPAEPPRNMQLAMVVFAAACIGLGVYPQPLYDILPYPVEYLPYTVDHVVSQLQLLMFAGLAFFVLLPVLQRTETITLDMDWLWRKPGYLLATRSKALLGSLQSAMQQQLSRLKPKLLQLSTQPIPAVGSGSMVSTALLMLALYLLIFFSS